MTSPRKAPEAASLRAVLRLSVPAIRRSRVVRIEAVEENHDVLCRSTNGGPVDEIASADLSDPKVERYVREIIRRYNTQPDILAALEAWSDASDEYCATMTEAQWAACPFAAAWKHGKAALASARGEEDPRG